MAKIADFIGKKIVKIERCPLPGDRNDFLIIFENGLQVYFDCPKEENPFFSGGMCVWDGLDDIKVTDEELLKTIIENRGAGYIDRP